MLRTRWLVRAPMYLYRFGFGFVFGHRMLMLEHHGRRSGLPRHTVLEVVDDPKPDTYIIVSGFGGASQWYRNLIADPHVRVSIGRRRNAPAVATLLAPMPRKRRLRVTRQNTPERGTGCEARSKRRCTPMISGCRCSPFSCRRRLSRRGSRTDAGG